MPLKFAASALFDFLKAVDRELSENCTVLLIGGGAVAAIDSSHATTDIDLHSPGSREFDAAVGRLRAAGTPVLPVQIVSIAEAPEAFLDRTVQLPLKGTSRLTVLVPERHDLAMMKLARGYEHDLEALEDIHRIEPFDLETLVARFHDTDVVGPRRRFAVAFLDLIARIFGDETARRLNTLLDGLQ